jgi:uncharacterized Rossmann fold enzyme
MEIVRQAQSQTEPGPRQIMMFFLADGGFLDGDRAVIDEEGKLRKLFIR